MVNTVVGYVFHSCCSVDDSFDDSAHVVRGQRCTIVVVVVDDLVGHHCTEPLGGVRVRAAFDVDVAPFGDVAVDASVAHSGADMTLDSVVGPPFGLDPSLHQDADRGPYFLVHTCWNPSKKTTTKLDYLNHKGSDLTCPLST